jgi:amidophosphoribosyltransferase
MNTSPFDDDKLHEECGVFGIYGHDDAAALTALGLHALQHRGQEASGIVATDGHEFNAHRAPGLVDRAFSDKAVMARLKGHYAIGHNRYATTGAALLRNIQPLYADLTLGGFALAHNGNLTNAQMLKKELIKNGALFQSTTDTEVILHLVAISKDGDIADRVVGALRQVQGAYSIIACHPNGLIGVRDPMGLRPLVLGKLGDAHILASETCAFDIIGAQFVRDILPGEMVLIDGLGVKSRMPFGPAQPKRFCIFEYVYFARPDSIVEGESVYAARKRIGAELANEAPCQGADVIVPVPDSGVPAALGYAEVSGIPFEFGIIRNHYVGRTFIEPTDQIRHLGVKMKHNANRAYIEGKKVVLIDDSIVRGTTSRKIVDMVRAAGATEVHMRISSPPVSHCCFYGIATPSTGELLAHKMNVEEIKQFIGVDSLAYISTEGLYRAMKQVREGAGRTYCDACFTGDYAIPLTDFSNEIEQVTPTDLERRPLNQLTSHSGN